MDPAMDHDYSRSQKGPSKMGYRRGCRCVGCVDAGQEYLAQRRVRDAKRRARKDPTAVQTHGIGGYQRGCRCSECVTASLDERRSRVEKYQPGPDWSELSHLKPGSGVRRRAV